MDNKKEFETSEFDDDMDLDLGFADDGDEVDDGSQYIFDEDEEDTDDEGDGTYMQGGYGDEDGGMDFSDDDEETEYYDDDLGFGEDGVSDGIESLDYSDDTESEGYSGFEDTDDDSYPSNTYGAYENGGYEDEEASYDNQGVDTTEEQDDSFVGIGENGEIIEDDRDYPVDADGNLIVMDGPNDDAFEFKYIDVKNIVIGDRIRKNSEMDAVTTSIKKTGLLLPVVVAPTATEDTYVLIEGLRRLMGCVKSGIRRIPCIINKNAKSTELRILEAMYNHSTPYTIREMLKFIDYLEKERGITRPSTIEYLLQMETGDYTKLKDVISDGDENIVTPLMNGQMTIGQAFKKLESRRKKETREEKENKKASDVYADSEKSGVDAIDEVGEIGDENVQLTPDELKELGFTQGSLDDGLEDQSLEDMVNEGKEMEGYEPHKQDYKNREKLDPALRKAVLARDANTSRVDPNVSGQEYTECLDVHHIHEVYLGGTDDIDNLITVDTISHKLIHLWARGELHIGNLDEKSPAEQEKFKRIIKLGNVIREDMQARGMKIADLKKVDEADTIGRTKPGTGQVAG